jgi:hypothetical protein
MAEQAVEVGYGIMNGKKPENPMVLMPSTLMTRDNVKDYKGWSSPRRSTGMPASRLGADARKDRHDFNSVIQWILQ